MFCYRFLPSQGYFFEEKPVALNSDFIKSSQASSDQTMLDIMGEVTTKLNPQLNIPYDGS